MTRVLGVDEARERLKATGRGIDEEQTRAVRAAAIVVENEVKRQLTNRSLNVDTGSLRASFTSAVFVVGGEVRGVVGSPLKYARIHETGGTIRPKNARALTVPLSLKARRGRAQDFADAFILNTADGRAFLVQPDGDGLEFLYVLKDQVTIPRRPYLSRASKVSNERVAALVGGAVARVVADGGG